MKVHQSLPQNEAFFGYYARLIPTLFKVGFLSQAFSAVIEMYILYSILRPKFEGVTDKPGAAALTGALFLVVLLEVGLRTSAAFSVRAILYRKFRGLDLPMSAFIFLLSGSLLLCSVVLHIEGAKEAVEANNKAPEVEQTAHVERSGQSEAEALLRAFSQDSTTVATTYAALLNAARAEATAKERAYLTRSGATGAGAAAIRAKGAAKVATLEEARAAKMERILEAKDSRLERVKSRQYAAADEITGRNKKRIQANEARLNKYAGYLSTFSVLTVLFFLLTIALNEIHKKGAGIEEVAIASQYEFEEGVFEKLATAVNDKFQYHARRAIDRIEESIPSPRPPLAPHPLFDWAGTMPERVAMQTRERRPYPSRESANNPGGDERKHGAGLNGKHNDSGAQTGHRPGGDENGGLFVATKQTPPSGGGANTAGGEAPTAPAGTFAAAVLGGNTARAFSENKAQPAETAAGENTREVFYFMDKNKAAYTIEHSGKHYTLRDVNSFVNTYTRRADLARKQQNTTALKSREEALKYWQGRRAELLKKMQAAT